MRTKPLQDTKEKNEMLIRSIESELEQLNSSLHTTNTLLTRLYQELRIIKWVIIAIVVLLGLISIKLGAF